MTVTMTAKNQITIPKKITDALGLIRGAMFEVNISRDGIGLIPLEIKEKQFSDEEYVKLEALTVREKGKERHITKKFINDLKKGKA